MPKELERRAQFPFEIREDKEDGTVRVVGHAAVFNQEARIGDFFRERIEKGAFRDSIERNDDVPFLINHSDLPLARTTSGTLRLSEDEIGLRVEARLDMEDPDVQRIVPKLRRGDLSKMSFAFRATKDEWDERDDDIPLRTLRALDLFDVSVVTTPAYDGTDIGLRSLEGARESERIDAEKEAEEKRKNFENARRRVQKRFEIGLRERGIPPRTDESTD